MKSVKLLHISDLHIGKRLMEVSLLEDQKYIVDQILSIIDDERPDAVLIAGDVYPGPGTQGCQKKRLPSP